MSETIVPPPTSPAPGTVVWDYFQYPPKPTWSREPNKATIENLFRRHVTSQEAKTGPIKITELKPASTKGPESELSKLFLINLPTTNDQQTSDGIPPDEYIFRVNLPIQPYYKTASEVATLEFLRKYFLPSVPSLEFPTIIAHDFSPNNDLGFEWILLQKAHGTGTGYDADIVELGSVWLEGEPESQNEENNNINKEKTTLSPEERLKIVVSWGRLIHTFRTKMRFRTIGSLYRYADLGKLNKHFNDPNPDNPPEFDIGPLVSPYLYLKEGTYTSTSNFDVAFEETHGPFKIATDYFQDICNTERKYYLRNKTDPRFLQACTRKGTIIKHTVHWPLQQSISLEVLIRLT